MKEGFDEIRKKAEHIQNHIHWWLCPYGHVMHQNERTNLLTCLRADALALVETCDQMLAETDGTPKSPTVSQES